MSETVIAVQGLTKDYGGGRGVFGLDFAVEQGEVFGFLGPNGAGKTTTLRQLMGFIRPDRGRASIFGMDCFSQAAAIQAQVGYLPGELALMEDMTGDQFIGFIARMKGIKDGAEAGRLCRLLELDGRTPIRKMSKGTKQKVGLVCAFMAKPRLLLLDEPTSGLDPLMQNRFVELVLEAKERGATVLLSSHLFEEVERTCGRAAILRAGRLVAVEPVEALRRGKARTLTFTLPGGAEAAGMAAAWPGARARETRVSVTVNGPEQLQKLLALAAGLPVQDLEARSQTLEELFLHFYGEGSEVK